LSSGAAVTGDCVFLRTVGQVLINPSPTLAEYLLEHAQARGAVLPTDRLLRPRNATGPANSQPVGAVGRRIPLVCQGMKVTSGKLEDGPSST
jgi:hypothetical protein